MKYYSRSLLGFLCSPLWPGMTALTAAQRKKWEIVMVQLCNAHCDGTGRVHFILTAASLLSASQSQALTSKNDVAQFQFYGTFNRSIFNAWWKKSESQNNKIKVEETTMCHFRPLTGHREQGMLLAHLQSSLNKQNEMYYVPEMNQPQVALYSHSCSFGLSFSLSPNT